MYCIRSTLPPISVAKRYQTTVFHGDRRKSDPQLPSVIINEDQSSADISLEGIQYLNDPNSMSSTPWRIECKSRSESCLSDGYFSGFTGALSVNTAYSDLDAENK